MTLHSKKWVFAIILILGLQTGVTMVHGAGTRTTMNFILKDVPAG